MVVLFYYYVQYYGVGTSFELIYSTSPLQTVLNPPRVMGVGVNFSKDVRLRGYIVLRKTRTDSAKRYAKMCNKCTDSVNIGITRVHNPYDIRTHVLSVHFCTGAGRQCDAHLNLYIGRYALYVRHCKAPNL